MSLQGKVAIVTGSAGGIGRGIAEKLASFGAQVIVTSRTIERAEQVAGEIKNSYGLAVAERFELEDKDSGKELITNVYKQFNRIDILVNNAISHPTLPPVPLEDVDYNLMLSGITANFTNILYLTAQTHPYLKETKGSVLNIGSAVVNRNMLGVPLYTILKGGISQMTKSLAAEWAKDGIKVNQINPGMVHSEAYKNIGIPAEIYTAMVEKYTQFHPLGRVGKPEEIGTLAAQFLSDEVTWMTGAIVDMDGGYSIQGVNLF